MKCDEKTENRGNKIQEKWTKEMSVLPQPNQPHLRNGQKFPHHFLQLRIILESSWTEFLRFGAPNIAIVTKNANWVKDQTRGRDGFATARKLEILIIKA